MERTHEYPQIMNLGAVRVTDVHDYRQVCIVVLMAMAAVSFVVWAQFDGLLAHVYDRIGPVFMTGFAFLAVSGFTIGIAETWSVSRGINAIKAVGSAENDVLRAMFGLAEFRNVDVDLLKEEIADHFELKADKVHHTAELAALLGLIGTVYGLVLAFAAVSGISSAEDVFGQLPEISRSLSLAFYTTLVGASVYVVINQVYRSLRNASVELKNRVFRSLHELTPQ